MIKHLDEIVVAAVARGKKRLAVAYGQDTHTIEAVYNAWKEGLVEATLYGDKATIEAACAELNLDPNIFNIVHEPSDVNCVRMAVAAVTAGDADVLMKGLVSTDKYMRGILNKETGLLPPKAVLSHVVVIQNPNYHKLMFVSDIAVIPAPDFKQKLAMVQYVSNTAKAFGIERPKVAMIAATEQMLQGMPACVEAAMVAKMSDRGQIPGCVVDGPLAVDVALSAEAVKIKKLASEVAGDADCLVFPSIEAANVFYKTNTQLTPGTKMAAMVAGAKAPCVLSSRADSVDTKLNSIALAAVTAK